MKQYSNDVKEKVMKYYESCKNKTETARVFCMSRVTVQKWFKLKEEGRLYEYKKPVGQKSRVNLIELKKYVEDNPESYYREIGEKFNISISQAQYLVTKLGFVIKKRKIYQEGNEKEQKEFQEEIKDIPPEKMIWLDETGIDKFIHRENVKARRGEVLEGKISGRRFVRQSIIAGLNSENKLVAPMVYTGTANREVIEVWLKKFLLPTIKENSVIILDNASIHKVASVRKLIEEAGHQLIYLPPYSPQLNPIEHKWHQLKQNLRGYYDNNLNFENNLFNQINKLTTYI